MFIEKEFPEDYIRNEKHKTLLNIVFTSHWIADKVRLFLEDEDITSQQYNLLRILRQSKTPLSTLKIRELMIDKMSDTSRIVERMVKKEFVYKQVSKQDKRLVDVTLSLKGLTTINKLEKKAEELDSVINNLNTQEVAQLNNLLDKIRG